MAEKKSVFQNLVDGIYKNKTLKVGKLIEKDPEIAAFISKLINPNDRSGFRLESDKQNYNSLNQNELLAISESTKKRIKDNENLLSLFPDIELAIQILVSSVLSPKDMVKTELIYRMNNDRIPSEISAAFIDLVNKEITNYYKLNEELPTIVRETLFTNGSYVKAILPESSIDAVINNNYSLVQESISELYFKNDNIKNTSTNLGLLGNSGKEDREMLALEKFAMNVPYKEYNGSFSISHKEKKISLESFIDITDNFLFLKLPELNKAINRHTISNVIKQVQINTLSTSNESVNISNTKMSNLLYRNSSSNSQPFVAIPTEDRTKRKSIGRPMVFKIPTESTIPIYTPGNEKEHVGYFVILDIDGNPITKNTNSDRMLDMANMIGSNQNNDLVSMLISKAKNNLSPATNTPTIDQIAKVYSNIIENDLIERLKNGVYKQELAISNNEEIYRIMLSRAFANKFTRLVFIPAELVTYFAFNYHNNGTGKSYLDDLKILTSLRGILLFAKVMATVKSAINLTHVNVTLDPDDPDPRGTIETATQEVARMRQQFFPLGVNNAPDLVDWIQRAGFEFSYEGHPGIPNTKLDFEVKNMQHTIPDNELDDLLRKQSYMTIGLPPEIVDNGFASEFATTVVTQNVLLSRRVIQLQNILIKHTTPLVQKIVSSDKTICGSLLQIIKNNKGSLESILTEEEKQEMGNNEELFLEKLLSEFISSIETDLPKPDETTIETQSVAFDAYAEALDKAIGYWISTDIITSDIAGDISNYIENIKAIVKSYYIRKWMADNNYLSELNDLVIFGEDNKITFNLYEENKTHMEAIVQQAIKFIDSNKLLKEAANSDLNKIGAEPAESSDSGNEGGNSSSNDLGGFDDLGNLTGGEAGSDNELPPEEAPKEDSPEEPPAE